MDVLDVGVLAALAFAAASCGQAADVQACAACHAKIAEHYALTPMARSFGTVAASAIPDAVFEHKASNQVFSLRSDAKGTLLERYQRAEDGSRINVLQRRLDYRFGSGNHARSYLSRNASGDLIELPLTWYAENGGHWGMSPAYEVPQHSGFSRKITERCMFCHNAYPARFPTELPAGIDCERCHGKGESHIIAARQGEPAAQIQASILNPARLNPERQLEICMQCHLETTNLRLPPSLVRYGREVFSYRPAEPLSDYMLYFDHAPGTGHDDKFEFDSAAYRLRKSPCFLASAGKLTCTACHDPHGEQPSVIRTAQACNTCHATSLRQRIAASTHPASTDCVSCHMPKRQPSDAVHVVVTDHYIQKHPAPEAPRPVERNEGNSPPYRGAVVPYYPALIESPADRALYVAVAQVRNQANLGPGIPLLEAAIQQFRPARGEFYVDLAAAYRLSGKLEMAIDLQRQACTRMPADGSSFRNLGILLIAAGDLEAAAQALNHAADLSPREPAVLEALADALAKQRKFPEALSALQAAATLDPDSAALQNNLGTAYLRTGDKLNAEKALREAVRLRPEQASLRLNLGNFLALTKDSPAAAREFQAALLLNPQYAEARSAYATSLASSGKLIEARDQFQQALKLNPNLAATHNNLGTVLRQLGDSEGAIREYGLAITAQPASPDAHYFEAHLNLAALLLARGQTAQAVNHLRKAAESPDPATKQAALTLLNKSL